MMTTIRRLWRLSSLRRLRSTRTSWRRSSRPSSSGRWRPSAGRRRCWSSAASCARQHRSARPRWRHRAGDDGGARLPVLCERVRPGHQPHFRGCRPGLPAGADAGGGPRVPGAQGSVPPQRAGAAQAEDRQREGGHPRGPAPARPDAPGPIGTIALAGRRSRELDQCIGGLMLAARGCRVRLARAASERLLECAAGWPSESAVDSVLHRCLLHGFPFAGFMCRPHGLSSFSRLGLSEQALEPPSTRRRLTVSVVVRHWV
ncbi:unnamed protein product [Prorocentrum cordatum]|uniref:Uncharacterized protein n=1 Tax=Prorocentrum cordatum TaxID=2364126 RepID=A0ABN9WPQ7_9DINO|nr:unnamed protein product [Polarella glacialis]